MLFSRGASLALCDVNFEQLKNVAKSLEAVSTDQRLSFHSVDVSKTEEVNRWTDGILKEFGKLDGAANIAGVVRRSPLGTLIEDTTDEDWEFTMQINAFGV